MPALRLVAHAAVIALFAGFAVWGVRGWMGGGAVETPAPLADEIPLKTGYVENLHTAHYASMGYPWIKLRPEMLKMKNELPPDPAPVDIEEQEKRIRNILMELRFEMPSGRVPFPKYFEIAKSRIEPHGVKVQTAAPYVRDGYLLELPAQEWTGISVFGYVQEATHRDVVFDVNSEGVAVGTDQGVNRLRRDAILFGTWRRVAGEHADPVLDAEVRPDVLAADIVKFVRNVSAQTGVDIAIDVGIWEQAYALTWRGRPRKLRDALDELCTAFRWYWRWNGERVWLLKP